MVCAIQIWPDYELAGIHRTYLNLDGNGKAGINNNKMMLGNIKGGAVRFGELGQQLIITEGIETSLSIRYATGYPTWAALSASNMKNIILPDSEHTGKIIITADNDKSGIEAANFLASKLKYCDYNVSIAIPNQPGWDFNDLLREVSHVN